jgi:hypothetical protein
MELAGLDRIRKDPWQTDTSINPGWFYMGHHNKLVVNISFWDGAAMT